MILDCGTSATCPEGGATPAMRSPDHPISRSPDRNQRGYALLVVLLLLAMILLAAMAAAPRLAQQIRRDREEELIHRGTQYARAIKRYYKKFGHYPASLEQLEDTNHLRFLRRRYPDPMTPDGKWRIIHVGEAKVMPKSFAPPSGQAGGIAGATPAGALAGPSAPGSPSVPGSQPGEIPQVGTPAAAMSTPLTGQTFGGGPIVGVASTSKQASIRVLNDKDHYNDWEFVYDPRLDLTAQQPAQALPPGAQPVASPK
jgi:type II secretory pathway pseudopilin PulG